MVAFFQEISSFSLNYTPLVGPRATTKFLVVPFLQPHAYFPHIYGPPLISTKVYFIYILLLGGGWGLSGPDVVTNITTTTASSHVTSFPIELAV